jgi:hypothetical protein
MVSYVDLSVEIHCLKVTSSIAFYSSKFSSKFCNLSDPGNSVHSKKTALLRRTAHHHCQVVMVCRELSFLICHQFCQFASFKHQFDILMSSTPTDTMRSTCSS